jgi:multiple sugar transport system substrate-binding protein
MVLHLVFCPAHHTSLKLSGITRRTFLAANAALAPSCYRRREPSDGKLHLTFSTWGDPAETAAFQLIIDRYEQLHPKIKIDLDQISYKFEQQLDTRLAAHVGPDLFRVQYQNLGRYTPNDSLVDLTPYLPPGIENDFTASSWSAVQHEGKTRAMPHHTDTNAIQYNRTLFRQMGIPVPRSLDESWTWEQFTDIARAIRRKTGGYAIGMDWTFEGSSRWLNFLYQHGGALLTSDLRKSAIPSAAAVETLQWNQRWFHEELIPPSDSAKSSEYVSNFFVTGVVHMIFDYGLLDLRARPPAFDWSVTYMPRDRQFASDLGGNAVGISRDCRHPEIAADFLLFLTNEQNMRDFVLAVGFIPVRKSLLKQQLPYQYRPEEMKVYMEQSTTVPVHLARTVTLPSFPRILRELGDNLNLAFSANQDAALSVDDLARSVRKILVTS